MPEGTPCNQAVLALLRNTATITTIDEVISLMQDLDAALASTDGVKWFNLLYLLVTRAVYAGPSGGAWQNPLWLTRLDVVFAQLYFDALEDSFTDPAAAPRAWQALFDVRERQDIQRVQFALAGMNAHINHDLPLALVQVCREFHLAPRRWTPEYQDFGTVNTILDTVEPAALAELASGIAGQVAQDLGPLAHVVAMWSVTTARDTAWTNAELLWQLHDLPGARDNLMLVLDRITGFAGRGLLTPVLLIDG